MPFKLCYNGKEWDIGKPITIGRASSNTIVLTDGMVSSNHAVIENGCLKDTSTNGTMVNGKVVCKNSSKPHKLKGGDVLVFGEVRMTVQRGDAAFASPEEEQDLMRSKRFGGALVPKAPPMKEKVKLTSAQITALMDEEFSKIIGHDGVKDQLKQFHKKVQLDEIRKANGRLKDKNRLYHMIFTGPPGTGKTTMANLVASLLQSMGLIENDSVVFVNNALDLLAGFVGQTPAKVDAKVEEAKGGVLFIDEAYSIVKSKEREKDSFGKEAIDTIMKHLDPPSCVFIFAGYEKEMSEFLAVNAGLARRIPYRFGFQSYKIPELVAITLKMVDSKGEIIQTKIFSAAVEKMLRDERLAGILDHQNAGFLSNWIAFAQIERDDRIDIDEAMNNPKLALTLEVEDMEVAMVKTMESLASELMRKKRPDDDE